MDYFNNLLTREVMLEVIKGLGSKFSKKWETSFCQKCGIDLNKYGTFCPKCNRDNKLKDILK